MSFISFYLPYVNAMDPTYHIYRSDSNSPAPKPVQYQIAYPYSSVPLNITSSDSNTVPSVSPVTYQLEYPPLSLTKTLSDSNMVPTLTKITYQIAYPPLSFTYIVQDSNVVPALHKITYEITYQPLAVTKQSSDSNVVPTFRKVTYLIDFGIRVTSDLLSAIEESARTAIESDTITLSDIASIVLQLVDSATGVGSARWWFSETDVGTAFDLVDHFWRTTEDVIPDIEALFRFGTDTASFVDYIKELDVVSEEAVAVSDVSNWKIVLAKDIINFIDARLFISSDLVQALSEATISLTSPDAVLLSSTSELTVVAKDIESGIDALYKTVSDTVTDQDVATWWFSQSDVVTPEEVANKIMTDHELIEDIDSAVFTYYDYVRALDLSILINADKDEALALETVSFRSIVAFPDIIKVTDIYNPLEIARVVEESIVFRNVPIPVILYSQYIRLSPDVIKALYNYVDKVATALNTTVKQCMKVRSEDFNALADLIYTEYDILLSALVVLLQAGKVYPSGFFEAARKLLGLPLYAKPPK